MSFADTAITLAGQTAIVFGWRPADFWNSTPAELDCILTAYSPRNEGPPDAADLHKLMEQFPDG